MSPGSSPAPGAPPPAAAPPADEPLPLLAALIALTLVSGLVDAASYLGLGHVFTANMTGNVVVLGFAAAGAAGFSATATLTSLGVFLVGAVAAGRLAARITGRDRLLITTMAAEILLVGAAALVASLASSTARRRGRRCAVPARQHGPAVAGRGRRYRGHGGGLPDQPAGPASPGDARIGVMSDVPEAGDVPEVTDDGTSRFELTAGGEAAELLYRRRADRLVLIHTGVPRSLAGHGIGGTLVRAAVSRAAAEGLTVVPLCSFARDWLQRHPAEAAAVTIDWGDSRGA